MLYNENEVVDICQKYGIETVEKEGFPLYMGEEMDEEFSFSEVMHEVNPEYEDGVSSSSSFEISVPVHFEPQYSYNCCLAKCENNLINRNDVGMEKTMSTISRNSQIIYAV